MKKIQPISFTEWKKDRGKKIEIGVKVILTDKLQGQTNKNFELRGAIAKLLGNALAKALFDKGLEMPPTIYLKKDRNALLRGWEVFLVADAKLEKRPYHYLNMLFYQWMQLYTHNKYLKKHYAGKMGNLTRQLNNLRRRVCLKK